MLAKLLQQLLQQYLQLNNRGQACDVILKEIENGELKRISPKQLFSEVEALRRTLALRLHHPDVDIVETAAELQQLLFNDEIF